MCGCTCLLLLPNRGQEIHITMQRKLTGSQDVGMRSSGPIFIDCFSLFHRWFKKQRCSSVCKAELLLGDKDPVPRTQSCLQMPMVPGHRLVSGMFWKAKLCRSALRDARAQHKPRPPSVCWKAGALNLKKWMEPTRHLLGKKQMAWIQPEVSHRKALLG